MTIKMLVPHSGAQAGAFITLSRLEEDRLVASGKASYNLGKRLSWPPDERDGGVIGLFADTVALETAHPAAKYPGFSALVGTILPYGTYVSNGSAWVSGMSGANLAAELAALEIVGLDIIENGVEMTQIFHDVTNVAQVAALPTTPQKLSLYYAALDGDAGTIKVVVDAYGAAQAETRFSRSDGYTPINPGETLEITFDPRTRPSSVYVKATSALTGGKHNQLQLRERGTMMLPAIASSLSSKLRAWWPCDQASPDLVLTDRSGNSKNVAFPAALTAANAWASAGGLTVPYYPSTNTTLQYPRLSAAAFNEMFTFSRGDSILIHMDTDIVLPAANSYLFGSGNAPSASDRGFSLRVSPTGSLIGCFFPEGASSIYSTVIGTPPSAVGRHSVAMHVDATLKYMSIYLDGVAIRTGFDLSAVVSSLATTTGFGIGGAPTYAGGRDQGISQKIYDFQVYSWKASEGTLPTASEVAAIAARLHSVRGALLSQELV